MISIGRPPVRIDLLNAMPGVDFDEAWNRRKLVKIDGLSAHFIFLVDLSPAKRVTGRQQFVSTLKVETN
jgi:hypothetical protein